MSTSELDDVTALLERLLPDPSGFAERLFQQLVALFGAAEYVGTTATVSEPSDQLEPSTIEFEPSNGTSDGPSGGPTWDETLSDFNLVLAAALGACDCWGLQATCVMCGGVGSAGWMEPDANLFDALVGPAVRRMAGADATSDDSRHSKAHRDDNGDRTTEGATL